MSKNFKIEDGKLIDLSTGKKVSSKTITLGSKIKIDGVSTVEKDANVVISGDKAGQVIWTKSGKNIVIKVYKMIDDETVSTSVMGKIVLKNIGSKKTVTNKPLAGYQASLATDNGTALIDIDDFFAERYEMKYKNIEKSITLKGTFLNEDFIGGNKNDTIKAVGGNNTIYGGLGNDKMYAGEGEDEFFVNQGEAAVKYTKSGKEKGGDIIYKSTKDDTLIMDAVAGEVKTFEKDKKNNLIIRRTFNQGGGIVTDKITVKKFFDPKGTQMDVGEISGMEMNGSGKIVGTQYGDNITGSKKVDTITTGDGEDTINAKGGNDIITIDGIDDKTFIMNGGDGNDTISVSSTVKDNPDLGDVFLEMSKEDEGLVFTYAKNYKDLVITAINSDLVTKESVTLKNYFDVDIPIKNVDKIEGDFKTVYLNDLGDVETALSSMEDAERITISGVKVSQLLKELTYNGKPVSDYTKYVTIPSALKNANVFLGTEYNDLFLGTTGKDVMVSYDGDYNDFITGKSGQTGIASLGDSDDAYTVKSFDAGTGIYDKDGQYDLTMEGVDVNNLHMIKTDLSFIDNITGKSGILGYDVENIKTFTTTTGISKAEGIDLKTIGTSLKTIKEKGVKDPESIDAINKLLKLAPGALDKLKGVSVVTGESDFEFTDIDIIDKNKKEQIISSISQEVIQKYSSDALYGFMEDISDKYQIDITTKEDLAYLLFGVGENYAKLDGNQYNEIKDGFFDMFKNLYVGTSGNNSYTIKKTDNFAVASGTGSDTFVFSGKLETENGAEYNIISSLDKDNNDHDTIQFKNYTFNDMETEDGLIIEGTTVKGIKMESTDGNKSAVINYYAGEDGEGYDITNGRFSLNVKYKSGTAEIIAAHNNQVTEEGPIELSEDWKSDKYNHMANTYSDKTRIISNSKQNMIEAHSISDIGATLDYTYNKGNDTIESYGNSNGTYNAALTSSTQLSIDDKGLGDSDTLALTVTKSDLNKIRLFYDADKSGNSLGNITGYDFIYSTGLKISNFNIEEDVISGETEISIKNGIEVNNLNLNNDAAGIEKVTCGGTEIDLNTTIATIKENIADWFEAKGECDYNSVYDVLAGGNASDIKGILACYDNALVYQG